MIDNNLIEGFIKSFLGSYRSYRKEDQWCYEDGIILKGSYDLYEVTGDAFYLDFIKSYLDRVISDDGLPAKYDGEEFNLDNLQSGFTLVKMLPLVSGEKYQLALNRLVVQLEGQPTTKSGGYFHKARYPYQIWLDGLYMAEPFAAAVALKNGKDPAHIFTQFENIKDHLGKDGHLYHAYDESRLMQWADKKTGLSPNIWLRSVGWLMMGCIDVYELLHKDYEEECEILKEVLTMAISSILPTKDKLRNMFYNLPYVEDKRNYLETSGSVMVAYALIKGSSLKMTSDDYTKTGLEIFEGVLNHSFSGKHLDSIVFVSGLDHLQRDGSVDYYFSERVGADDSKGVGPFMMAYAQVLRSSK